MCYSNHSLLIPRVFCAFSLSPPLMPPHNYWEERGENLPDYSHLAWRTNVLQYFCSCWFDEHRSYQSANFFEWASNEAANIEYSRIKCEQIRAFTNLYVKYGTFRMQIPRTRTRARQLLYEYTSIASAADVRAFRESLCLAHPCVSVYRGAIRLMSILLYSTSGVVCTFSSFVRPPRATARLWRTLQLLVSILRGLSICHLLVIATPYLYATSHAISYAKRMAIGRNSVATAPLQWEARWRSRE